MKLLESKLEEYLEAKDFAFIKDYDLEIEKVTAYRLSKKLEIKIISDKLLLIKQIEELETMFKLIFKEFKIEIYPRYFIEGLDVLSFYKERIIELIRINTKSSNGWGDELLLDFKNGILTIYPPNQILIHMIKINGTIKDIERTMSLELGQSVKVEISDSKVVVEEDFLETKLIEEKEIAKKMVLEAPKERTVKAGKKEDKAVSKSRGYKFGKNVGSELTEVKDINLQSGNATVEGLVFDVESRLLKNNNSLVTFHVSDLTDSLTVKVFLKPDQVDEFLVNVCEDAYIRVSGDINYDSFSRCTVMMVKSLEMAEKYVRMDTSEEKRVELHLHTQMSSMDATVSLGKLLERAKLWGHKAIAITDHGVVQAYPEAMNLRNKYDIKIIYGMEGYLVNDKKEILTNYSGDGESPTFIVFDIETTGLSALNDSITEIGAIKIRDGEIVDSFSRLVNPERPIPEFITQLTGITDEMVRDQPTIDVVIPEFNEFIEDGILVAHNATFDIGFIRENMNKNGIELDSPVIDTLELARSVFPDLKNHKLNVLAKHLGVSLENHHRAVDDATATAEIFMKILEILEGRGMDNILKLNRLNDHNDSLRDRPFHVIIMAQNLVGLKNLYRLVSKSHIDYFYRQPRILKSLLEENREGLLIGSACEAGELYKAIVNNKSDSEIDEIVEFYDFLEIQPVGNNEYLVREGIVKDDDQLREFNKRIYDLGLKHNKKVVATGDVHFLDPEDEIYRRILMAGQKFKDADNQPPLYFKTTDEMLEEFSYLGEERAREVVIENPNYINDIIEDFRPIPEGTYPPIIEGSDEELRRITYEKAHELYGDVLPDIVEKRLERELTSIIKNGYAVMYIIAQKLVWKSLEDGYLVGSRGSVGSSFAATMSGITEINPLKPHYLCKSCKYSEFFEDGTIASGADLKDKVCPNCGEELIKDGHDIPFEVFLGFEGDKEPDIDLNFAGEYQSEAHKYTEELFGEGYVFRAGTIGTVAEKTAYGFVKKYYEAKEINVNPAEINRLVKGCTGIKRTSGQHPGGVMIVPKYKDILDFSPIQYPANDSTSGVITTHFDYNAISSNILKLDILGHDVPTIIRMLEDITGLDSTKIALDEEKTMRIFTSLEPLGLTDKDIDCEVGTLGIPEFGTKFVRQMLIETQPTTFSELVRISGLSHGTDVWINNAQLLVKDKVATLGEVISTREDIMLGLINSGMDNAKSFKIMEKVRKGKGLTDEEEASMREYKLPEWYIDSCKKIKYMFPKAHAAAYVMMSFRIAYFKVYYPEAFYATYFTIKAADFDADMVIRGQDYIKDKIKEIENLGYDMTAKDKNLVVVLEVALEMYCRGYKIQSVDLYKSDSDKFLIDDDGILPPLKTLDGLGENVARKIVEERELGPFLSREDLMNRAKVNKTAMEVLNNHGCLTDLPESNQLSLFNI